MGYYTIRIPGGAPESKTTLGFSLVNPAFDGTVSSVDGTRITLSGGFPPDSFPGGGIIAVHSGTTPGLTLQFISASNDEFTLRRSVDGLVSVGDTVRVREHQPLANYFGPTNEAGIRAGKSAAEADNIALWDIESQTSRVFYFNPTIGWVEEGKEAEGDKSEVPVGFPAGAVFTRRDPAPVSWTIVGHVPTPLGEQIFPVKHGPNILSLPVTGVERLDAYELFEAGSPFSVNAGASAPDADVLVFTDIEGGKTRPPVYYQLGLAGGGHWQAVGGGNADETPLAFTQALQLFRSGPDGFLRLRGVIEELAIAQGSQAVDEVDFIVRRSGKDEFVLQWTSDRGTRYSASRWPSPRSCPSAMARSSSSPI